MILPEKFKYFYFKKYPRDFIVEEKLNFPISGDGHVFYVFFEKKLLNTMDIVKYLQKSLNLRRNHIGIGGLKDKEGITRQWISIYKRTLNSKGGKEKFLNELSKLVKILKFSWGDRLLKVGDIKGNLFFIRLRSKINIDLTFKKKVERALDKIKKEGVPNYFGYQRFGKKFRNVKLGFKFLKGEKEIKDPFERQFKLQAVSSFVFNKYLDLRITKGYFNEILYGDIILCEDGCDKEVNVIQKGKQKLFICDDITVCKNRIPTGPVIGYDILFPSKDTLPYKLEKEVLKEIGWQEEFFDIYKKNEIYGIRRNLKVYLNDLRYKWQDNDLLLMFELPSGSYASVVVLWLEKLLEYF